MGTATGNTQLILVIWILSVIWLLPVLTHATSNTGGFGEFSEGIQGLPIAIYPQKPCVPKFMFDPQTYLCCF